MRSVESSAKTMEEAISLGLEKLEASIADVTIDIVEEGTKGFLGIGSKPFVVRLTVREEAEEADDVLGDAHLEDAMKEKTEKKPARKKQPKAEKTETAEKPEKAEKAEKPAKENKPKAEKKQPKAEAVKEEPVAEQPAEDVPETVMCDPATPEGKAQEFLIGLTTRMGVNVSVNARQDEEGNVRVDMFGDTLGILIGRRGETLDALQYLTSLYVNRGQEGYTRVTLDTENYRAKREEALRRLANRMANRAIKTGRKVVMEPMNPYERRILHSALQQNDAVTTHSEGEEPNRHVVITLKNQ
ncbi:MAG: Jag N-terminal domain-containing protein [Clostridia bacterium]|nr:Jag N-terminal domain-containing protein [Clostridia bacterium]